MQNPVRKLARPMLASIFVMGGVDQLRNPDPKVPIADDVAQPVASGVGMAGFSTRDLVQVNGAVQVAGGVALAFGRLPRLASMALAATLVPTTLAAHRFWDVEDPQARQVQQVQFMKNTALLGGLLIASQDTAGRPGAAWAAKHSVEHAAIKASEASAKLGQAKAEAELVAKTAAASTAIAAQSTKAAVASQEAAVATRVARGAVKAAVMAAGTAARLVGKRASKDVRQQANLAKKTVRHQAGMASTKTQALRAQVVPDVIDLTEKVLSNR